MATSLGLLDVIPSELIESILSFFQPRSGGQLDRLKTIANLRLVCCAFHDYIDRPAFFARLCTISILVDRPEAQIASDECVAWIQQHLPPVVDRRDLLISILVGIGKEHEDQFSIDLVYARRLVRMYNLQVVECTGAVELTYFSDIQAVYYNTHNVVRGVCRLWVDIFQLENLMRCVRVVDQHEPETLSMATRSLSDAESNFMSTYMARIWRSEM
jgi:hypothetical protein